jgi:hypothetical protein
MPGPLRVFLVEDFPPVRDLIVENLQEIAGLELAGVAEGEQDAPPISSTRRWIRRSCATCWKVFPQSRIDLRAARRMAWPLQLV